MEKIKNDFVNDIKIKIIVIIVLTTIISSVTVYTMIYSMTYNVTIQNLGDHAAIVNKYIRKIITADIFIDDDFINNNGELYDQLRDSLNEIREIANIEYLYAVKKNADGQLIYVLDGLSPSDPNYKSPGSLIEKDLIRDINRCLLGEMVYSENIFHTPSRSVYITYCPILDNYGNAVGAIGMEFNVDNIYNYYRSLKIWSITLLTVLITFFIFLSQLLLKKVSEPFYKKLAYTDYLTGLQNRMAFEETLKNMQENLSDEDNISLIIYDLNDLKATNDTLGHKFGDMYIKYSASLIAEAFKELGTTYRIGGDELSTIIKGHTEKEIQDILDKLFKTKHILFKNISFNCAHGLACFDPSLDKTLQDVFTRADQKMYENKKIQKGLKK